MKVYVLIKCRVIEVWEDSYCDCCGPDVVAEYNDEPKVVGVYSMKEELIKKLKELKFYDSEIKDFLNKKEFYEGNYFYYLEESELL